jgi:hypothetical protein
MLAEDTDQIVFGTAHFVSEWIEEHVIDKAKTFLARDKSAISRNIWRRRLIIEPPRIDREFHSRH